METGKRRIDRILGPGYAEELPSLPLDEVRRRRDECLAEREYLSLLRRLIQGRTDILQADRDRRAGSGQGGDGSLVDRLPSILSDEGTRGAGRGEAVRVGVPEEEMTLARRRVERLVADASISGPAELSDEDLEAALGRLREEERRISDSRTAVMEVHDRLQDELKRRYKEDPSQALSSG
jgi:hypothetical protein